jgi:hypothetical protein
VGPEVWAFAQPCGCCAGPIGMDPDSRLSVSARRRRNRALAIAGVAAAAIALAIAIGPSVIGVQSPADQPSQQGETPPPDEVSGLADVRPRDLTPEQVAQLPGATVAQAVIGADLDRRAVIWQGGHRQVLAVTTDGGESWTYTGEPGQYFALSGPTDPSGTIWVSVDGGGARREEAIIDPDGELVAIRPPRGVAPLVEGDVLVTYQPRRNAERQVAVDADGDTHYWPGDPWLGEQQTGVVGSWDNGVQLPTGVIVQEVAGTQADFGGSCCASRPVVRWSQDGGTTWSTRELDALGASADAIYPFTITIPSLDPETIAVHESTEGGTRTARPLLATQRFAADGSSADRFGEQFSSPVVEAAWSVVLPDGELLVWVESDRPALASGPWVSDGDDWSAMGPALDLAPPPGVDVGGLALVDVSRADGEARVVAVAPSGEMLVMEGNDIDWTRITGD